MDALIETKLYVPMRKSGLVPRSRLAKRLERATEAKLTVVSAPPGFGKTTLLADWLTGAPGGARSAAWVSLDERDNNPTSFWMYVIAALQTVAPQLGQTALSLLRSSQPPIDLVLNTLVNELNTLPNDVVLVLDDYHVVDDRRVHEGLAFLLDHLPTQLHLVIASRAEPALPLPRLRARGDLVEIRAADLRFEPDEAVAYLNEVMGLGLDADQLALLDARTEGWIAALQLAALSMQGRDDVASFIAGFAGDDRYIVDYLVEEVLQRQPQAVRDFLLQTCILERLNGALCDAVTRQGHGKAMLEALERGNLFVVPLDDRRQWYRYHHLFSDVLRVHLAEESDAHVRELHRRASAWYERNGDLSAAIEHALAAKEISKAADLLELAVPELRRNRQEAALLKWFAALPEQLLCRRPVLSNVYASVLLTSGQLVGAEARLRDAERWLAWHTEHESGLDAMDEPMPFDIADPDEARRLPGSIAVHRAGYAFALGHIAETVQHARRALELTPEDDHLARGSAAGLQGLAAWSSGDLVSAHQSWAAAIASLQRAGHLADSLGCTIALTDIEIVQGRLGDALRSAERALQLGIAHEPVLRGTADMYVALSSVYRERGDLLIAEQHLQRSHTLGEHTGLPQNRYRWRVAMARVREAQGKLDDALNLLREAERVYVGDLFPNVRPVAALAARVLVRQGRLSEALAWVAERRLSAADELSYVREFEHVSLARVLLARGAFSEGLGLLDRLLRAADDGGRIGSVVEILVLQALAHHHQGATRAGLAALERALTLAEPEGYVRIFVDEGQPMAALLVAAAKGRSAIDDYARRLLAAFESGASRPPVKHDLVEPLSDRELDVLRLLVTDLDGPDIARELTLSLNTVRTHTRNIYNKLGVNSRRAAVRRAEELELLPRAR